MTITRSIAAELVGPDEIARRLHVAANTIATWRARYDDFPRPLVVRSRVRLYFWRDVDAWALAHGRIPEVRDGLVSADDLATARGMLATERARVIAEVREIAETFSHLTVEHLSRPPARAARRDRDGRIVSNDGRGGAGRGEWDAFFALSSSERDRLRRWMTGTHAPDTYAAAIGTDDVEGAFAQLVNATKWADALRDLERGRTPRVSINADTTHPIETIFDDDAAPLYLAQLVADERERYAAWLVEMSDATDAPAQYLDDEEVF